MYNFDYLIKKIEEASFINKPYKHLWIEDFLSNEHFEELTSLKQVNTPGFSSPEEMLDQLQRLSYRVISFPGCITDVKEYFNRLRNNDWPKDPTTEGFGMTLRLTEPEEGLLKTLSSFFSSENFANILKKKFDLKESTVLDTGIQKYLHKYEITPHPDTRRKALTFMLNMNPSKTSENDYIHTHLCSLKEEYKYFIDMWNDDLNLERCWVPWEFCNTDFITKKNNSIVIFAPDNTTFHAVKLDYDHLRYQRTQLYGNLWYQNTHTPLRNIHYTNLLKNKE